jgi:peptidoglycan/LPS O-acetylase OafA/YrhL
MEVVESTADRLRFDLVASRRAKPLHIPSLDGLRAISFLIVFVAHAGLGRVVPGGFGVTVFFFLSGYLITTLMRLEIQRTGRVSLKHFYLRRALRILPPFYVLLSLVTVLGVVGFLGGESRPQLAPVAAQALHVSNYWIARHGWDGIGPGTGVYWSLAVEEHFYLVFPALFLILHRLRLTGPQKALCLWSLCILVLAWRCVLVLAFHTPADRTYLCSDTRVDSILFGCALAVWNNPVVETDGPLSTASAFWSSCLLAAGICLLLVTFVLKSPGFRETLRYTLQGVALTPVFIVALRWPNWPVLRLLNWGPAQFLGTLSYSLYLVHQAVLSAVERHLPIRGVGAGVVAFALSLGLAGTMYHFVEKPCARMRRRLSAVE